MLLTEPMVVPMSCAMHVIRVSPSMLSRELRWHAHAFLSLVVVGRLTGEPGARHHTAGMLPQMGQPHPNHWAQQQCAQRSSFSEPAPGLAQLTQHLLCAGSPACTGMQQRPLAPVTSCAGQRELSRAMHSVLGGVLTASSRENTGRMNFSSKSAHHSASWMVCGLLPPSLHSRPPVSHLQMS